MASPISWSAERVPRTRGDGPWISPKTLAWSSCSPHTRGWTVFCFHLSQLIAVFPAHAGMDRWETLKKSRAQTCSPHTRGWTAALYDQIRLAAVFPAHAGMDRRRN